MVLDVHLGDVADAAAAAADAQLEWAALPHPERAAVLRREKWLGYNVIGALTPQASERSCTYSGIPLLGPSRSVAQVAADAGPPVCFQRIDCTAKDEVTGDLRWSFDGAALYAARRRMGMLFQNGALLTDEDALDPLSGTAILNGIPVELAPVRAPAATA